MPTSMIFEPLPSQDAIVKRPDLRLVDFTSLDSHVLDSHPGNAVGLPSVRIWRERTVAPAARGIDARITGNVRVNRGEFMVSQTELASRDFLSKIRQISGILDLSTSRGRRSDELKLTVRVPSLFSDAAQQVFEIETCLHQTYPDAYLDIVVEDVASEH